MYGHRHRRFPFFGPILFGLGFLVALAVTGSSLAGGAAAGLGLVLFLPLLLLKLFFFLFIAGTAMKFVGRGFSGPRRRGPKRSPEPPSREQAEWQQHVRDARDELDELFPD